MLKIVLKLLLCFLAFGLTDVGAYNYDERTYSEKIAKSYSGANLGCYDASSNPASCRELKDFNFREKSRNGSFFAFEVSFVATKGAGSKPDFIVSPNGTVLPTNKDFNLVDSNKKGGDWLQIHNKHTDAKVDGSPHTHFPKQHGKSRTREIKRTDGGDLDRADSALKSGAMRQRKNRGDKGGS